MNSTHPSPLAQTRLAVRVCSFLFAGLLAAALCSCNSTKAEVQKDRAKVLLSQPILIVSPVSNLPQMEKTCDTLGGYFNVEVSKRAKGNVLYSKNIPGLKPLSNWDNLVKNGDVNANELASMAKAVGCQSAIAVEILEYNQYPPFKMVIVMIWIEAETGNIVGKVYNDVDIGDTQINYHYKSFSGQGPLKQLYEEFQFSEDLYQTAYLMPEKFKLFVAAFTTNVLFKEAEDESWWLWRVL